MAVCKPCDWRVARPQTHVQFLLVVLCLRIGCVDAVAERCTVTTISPSSGPSDGGTLLNLTGVALGDGSAWRCSFDGTLVGAEYHDDSERVSCFSPRRIDDAANITVNVSIDGGSTFCAGEALHYRFYEAPNVSSISPASGSAQGGTRVTVSGNGFKGLGGAVVCTFGSLRIGDDIRAGAVTPAVQLSDGQLECDAPSAHAASAVGSAYFSFGSLPEPSVVQPCNYDGCTGGVEPQRIYHFPTGHNLTLLGKAVHENRLIKLTRNLFSYMGAMKLSLFYPSAAAGVPLRDFAASWLQEVGRGSGADGYSFVFADLSSVTEPFGEMGVGDGLVVRFRTRGYIGEFNEGHGVIEALYNGSKLNQTFMGDSLRSFRGDAIAVRVHVDPSGLVVYFDGTPVLATYIPSWAPQVGWSFGLGGRTGERKDDHWIDDLRVQSGFLLDVGSVEFGVSLNGGADISLLAGVGGAGVSAAGGGSGTSISSSGAYTYTADPSVFSFSPTTGPERGNTTVRVVGSHFAGGSDIRCIFGGDLGALNVHGTYDAEERVLTCRSPAAGVAKLVPLEVSLNNKPDSLSASAVPYRFYAHPAVGDARGPDKHAAPAGVGTNVSLLGGNFTGGDDYRVAFSRATPTGSVGAVPAAIVTATFVNDSLVLAVAPPTISARQAAISLTLNGQQYTEPMAFPFFEVLSVSPSTGPTGGGTLVSINGTAFDAGGAYRCDFGESLVSSASRRDDYTLVCYSPADAMPGPRPLEVSLNARDFSSSNVSFGYYPHPPEGPGGIAVLPFGGPHAGGTLVAVRTSTTGGLGGGSHYLCRFGSTTVVATYVELAPPSPTVRGPHNHEELLRLNSPWLRPEHWGTPSNLPHPLPATYTPHGAVICLAPPNATATAGLGTLVVDFEVALNGQSFHQIPGGFTFYVPPNVTSIGPTRGPSAGGTLLTLALDASIHPALLSATSCRVGGKGDGLPYVHSRAVVAALSPTAQIADGVLQCPLPPANRTGALGRTFLDFSSAASTVGDLYGDAALVVDRDRPCLLGQVLSCGGSQANNYTSATSAQCEWLCPVHEGHLRLTSGDWASSGSFILHTPSVPLAPAPREFNASFDVLIGRPYAAEFSPEGDGSLTFNFGELPPAAIGLTGAARGLSLQLFFVLDRLVLEVWLHSTKLLEAPVGGGVRISAWVPCLAEVAHGALSFTAGRLRIVDRLPLPGWEPLPTWRFGWSASTTSERDEFLLDNVEVRAATLLAAVERTVELTLNGQQFEPAGQYGYYGAAAFPALLSFSPTSGPVLGGTNLRLASANADGNLSLVLQDPFTLTAPASSTSAYRCFLGDGNITATYHDSLVAERTNGEQCTTHRGLASNRDADGRAPSCCGMATSTQPVECSDIHFPVCRYYQDAFAASVSAGGVEVGRQLGKCYARATELPCERSYDPPHGREAPPAADTACPVSAPRCRDALPPHYRGRCDFATANGTVRCTTLPFQGAAGAVLPLRFSVNAQDAIGPVAHFTTYGPVLANEATPTSGPVDGGTMVLFKGSGFGNGSDYRCRFGSGAELEEHPGHDVVIGSFDEGLHAIRCISPPAAGLVAGGAALYVSLNGQNYARAAELVFNYTAANLPSGLSPTTGPSDGATTVTVSMDSSLVGAFAPSCKFGNALSEAVAVGGALRCDSPSGLIVPARARLDLLYNATDGLVDQNAADWIRGAAERMTGGELKLTTGEAGSAGSLLLPVAAINGTGLRFRVFRVSFQLRVHLGSGGDGFSFSYGLLPPGAIGESGGGLGLRVAFKTAARCPPPRALDACPVVEVRYATSLLVSVPLRSDFRGAHYAGVVIEYTAKGLRVAHRGFEYVADDTLHIPSWAPTAAWSMAFGGRSGLATDVHEMRALSVELGSLVDAMNVPLKVSLNSQQFTAVPGGFTYFGSPNVTLLSPATGPTLGGTPALMLAGTGLHTYGGVHGGSHYRCRFGSQASYTYSPATLSEPLDEVYCVAPAGDARHDLPVALSLNGQQFHEAPSMFDRLNVGAAAADATASPTSGPIRGGTVVAISLPTGSAASLTGGDDYRCRWEAPTSGNDTRVGIFGDMDAGQLSGTQWSPFRRPLGASTVVTYATFDSSTATVKCASPPYASAAAATNTTLQLALNALHFFEVAPFEFYEEARVSILSPSSGPLDGGAKLLLIGSGFERGSHAQCWLGSGRSNATFQEGGSQLRCDSPASGGPHNNGTAEATTLRVSLNAQQASHDASFVFYPTPTPTLLLPDNGDAGTDGVGTLVRVLADGADGSGGAGSSAHGYANGTDYRCKFGPSAGSITPATLAADHELVCNAPSNAAAEGFDLRVALNGQQYGPGVHFDLLPPPVVSSIEPRSGVYAGAALISVIGTSFAERTQLACRFGDPRANAAPAATAPATFVNDELVRCYSPSADDAALSGEWSADFDEGLLPRRTELLGDAQLLDGSLLLTDAKPMEHGGFVIETTNRAARYFDARFSVLMGAGLGGDGMSFCYGSLSLSKPFDEMGSSSGLCVRLRSHTFLSLEISCNGTHLAGIRIGGAIRAGSFAPITFRRQAGAGAVAIFEPGPEGTGIEVTVSEAELSPLYVPDDTWRFGFGARCGQHADRHMVDSISIRSAAFTSTQTLPFSVANNGQQFARAQGTDWEFYAPPEISSISPASGPSAGSTRVTVYGAHLANGHDPYCRFPQSDGPALAVNASRVSDPDGTGSGLVCLSPSSADPASSALEVALNGQQFTKSALIYDALGPAVIGALSPSCGPTDGGTRVNVSGASLRGGTDLICKYTPSGGAAQWVAASQGEEAAYGALLCDSPRTIGGVADLAVSPNAQQFSQPSDFAFYAPPVVSTSSPSSGPSLGGTVVVVHGSSLTPTPAGSLCDVVCRFGDLLVPGSAVVSSGSITCVSPESGAANGHVLDLRVSLNRQDYSAGSATFSYTSPLGLSIVLPASGPIAGGTVLTATAASLEGGDDYTCRFLASDSSAYVVNASFAAGSGHVHCIAPSLGAPGTYNFSVSLNRQDYRTPLPFSYYGSPVLASVSPSSGPTGGGALVAISGTHLPGGDSYICRFGDELNLTSAATFNESDGMVHCVQPPAPAQGSVLLRVTHNAQQYAPSPLPFEFFAKPALHQLFPTSGPSSGGTLINVTSPAGAPDDSCAFYALDGVCDEPWVCAAGTDCSDCAVHNGTACGLRPGSDRRCRFTAAAGPSVGDGSVASASVAGSVFGAQLLCMSPPAVSPPVNGSSAGSVHSVSISLNGQQYAPAEPEFTVYHPPTVSHAHPSNGPSSGGTRIIVSGSELGGRSHYECEIGGVHLPATYDESNGTVVCSPTPPALVEAVAPLRLRLNLQETVQSDPLTFHVTTPPQLDAISPSSGPLPGNTTVAFHGSGFVDTASLGELRCRFGAQQVSATLETAKKLVCISPPASYAGAAATYKLDLTGDTLADEVPLEPPNTRRTAHGVLLLGSALLRPVAYAEDRGYVRLSQSAYDWPGAAILPEISPPYAGSPYFDATFDVRIWGSAAHHGLSFCYGEMPAHAWGEMGASLGLCIQLATPIDRVLVHHAGRLVHNASVPDGAFLRNRLWRGMRVAHSLGGRGLLVELDGFVVLSQLALSPPLQPLPTWRFGFGARTGPNVGQLEERHDFRNFAATLGAIVGPSRIVPQLTLNGQQYIGAAPFDYYPAAMASSAVTPESGPTGGGTHLTVVGILLHGGSDYRCRFSPTSGGAPLRTQPASLVGDAVLCNSSDGTIASAAEETIEVSLNGQQYATASALNFSVYTSPVLSSLSPSAGPALGETVVALTLAEVPSRGANHTCRFGVGAHPDGPVVVAGTVGVGFSSPTMLCTAPAVVRPTDPLYGPRPLYGDNLPRPPLEYSLNGQQYTTDANLYSYLPAAAPSSASPTTGPLAGGTVVRVRGSDFWGPTGLAPDRICRFGDARVPASKTSVVDELRCIAPEAARGSAGSFSMVEARRPLRVSLNGQQFGPVVHDAFEQYALITISSIAPSSGPATGGGTRITVHGAGLDGLTIGSHPRCAFASTAGGGGGGGPIALNATRMPGGSLLCVSPPGLDALTEPLTAEEGAAALSLSVSLNAQQYSNGTTFRAFRPHNISSLTPDSGLYLGGTSVNLTLSSKVLNTSDTTLSCWFGRAIVPGTLLPSGEDVRCASPSSALAGAQPYRSEEFVSLPQGATLYGQAVLHAGVLQLTPSAGMGAMALTLPNLGSSAITISFDLLLGTGGGGNGISVMYGPVPNAAFGEAGPGTGTVRPSAATSWTGTDGIEVWVRTGAFDLLQVSYRGRLVEASRMYGAIRTDAFLNATLSVSSSGDFFAVFGDGSLRIEAQLEGWSPQIDWRVGFGGRCEEECEAPENAQWVDNLVVHSDALVETASVELCLSINGQQCLGTSTFSYNALWVVSSSYPAHGPASGGTQVTVFGSNFAGGAADEYSCRLGSQANGYLEVPATLGDASPDGSWGRVGAALTCTTPVSQHPHPTFVELHVSSNRQEYPPNSTLGFHFYAHPVVDVVLPTAGPTEGGTLLRIYGTHLHGGKSGRRRCKMGGVAVPASLDASSGALLCFSPPSTGGVAATHPLQVALNMEHFTSDQPTFTYYHPPSLASIQPQEGFSNGTVVTASGYGVWRDGALCRFGAAMVNASRVDDSSITCAAPPAAHSGAWGRVALTFSEPWVGMLFGFETELRGHAYVSHGPPEGGILHLVDFNSGSNSVGPGEANAVGSIVLSLPQPALPPTHFRATWRLRMGRGSGADGSSFSYGDLALGAIGELGSGHGLRVCFRTHHYERVEIWYANDLLHVSSPPAGHSLRGADFADVLVKHDASGLTVGHKGISYVRGLRIDRWAPALGWRFAIGARSGGEADDHHIDDLVIDAGSASAPETSPLSVSLNGLQFTSALPFVYNQETADEAGADYAQAGRALETVHPEGYSDMIGPSIYSEEETMGEAHGIPTQNPYSG